MGETTGDLHIVKDALQGTFVGRAGELARLTTLLSMTEELRSAPTRQQHSPRLATLTTNAPRRPRCVLRTGGVGMGKTRLAEEIARVATRHNWAVMGCRAAPDEKGDVPYRLWIELLRKARSQGLWNRDEVAARPRVYQPLRQLLPELEACLPLTL